jgi:hypothetical protein
MKKMTNQDKQAKLKMEEAVARYTGPITKIPPKITSRSGKINHLPARADATADAQGEQVPAIVAS